MGRSLPAFLRDRLPDRPEQYLGVINQQGRSTGFFERSGSAVQDQNSALAIGRSCATTILNGFLMRILPVDPGSEFQAADRRSSGFVL